VDLHERFFGERLSDDDPQIVRAFELFRAVQAAGLAGIRPRRKRAMASCKVPRGSTSHRRTLRACRRCSGARPRSNRSPNRHPRDRSCPLRRRRAPTSGRLRR
jgi:hypothetical protein